MLHPLPFSKSEAKFTSPQKVKNLAAATTSRQAEGLK